MPENNDKFREQAAEAQRQADCAQNDMDKQSWLKLAQGWMSLIRGPKPSAAEPSFDADEKARGTNQKKSDDSH